MGPVSPVLPFFPLQAKNRRKIDVDKNKSGNNFFKQNLLKK